MVPSSEVPAIYYTFVNIFCMLLDFTAAIQIQYCDSSNAEYVHSKPHAGRETEGRGSVDILYNCCAALHWVHFFDSVTDVHSKEGGGGARREATWQMQSQVTGLPFGVWSHAVQAALVLP